MPTTDTHPRRALLDLFARRGFSRVQTAILQPAGIFLELSGEDIRRRLFLMQDAGGEELCLRPEHTIPVCRSHLASGDARGDYCYLGPVFRQRLGESGEFDQAGFESFGGPDEAAADAAALHLGLEVLALFGPRHYLARLGDAGLLDAVFRGLEIPPPAQRRLRRALAAGHSLDAAFPAGRESEAGDYAGLLAAIEGQDPEAARAFVEDVISIAGLSAIGGRSAGEIAERFLSRAANRSGAVPESARATLNEYLAIDDEPERALSRIRAFAKSARLDLENALARAEKRVRAMAELGLDLARCRFAASFARSLDYYTGFVFEIRDPVRADGRYVAAGGRYDRLLQHLGNPDPIPAIGCSFWLDRLGGEQP